MSKIKKWFLLLYLRLKYHKITISEASTLSTKDQLGFIIYNIDKIEREEEKYAKS